MTRQHRLTVLNPLNAATQHVCLQPYVFVICHGGHLEGLVTRASLEGLMSQNASEVPVGLSLEHGATLSSARESLVPGAPIGVDIVMDVAPYVVQTNTPVLQAHMTFRQNGIRHMIVVDGMHRPVGVLTIKSLMTWRTRPPGHTGSGYRNSQFSNV